MMTTKTLLAAIRAIPNLMADTMKDDPIYVKFAFDETQEYLLWPVFQPYADGCCLVLGTTYAGGVSNIMQIVSATEETDETKLADLLDETDDMPLVFITFAPRAKVVTDVDLSYDAAGRVLVLTPKTVADHDPVVLQPIWEGMHEYANELDEKFTDDGTLLLVGPSPDPENQMSDVQLKEITDYMLREISARGLTEWNLIGSSGHLLRGCKRIDPKTETLADFYYSHLA
jgi:hypothetical protein